MARFQPSSDLQAGCNDREGVDRVAQHKFQPSSDLQAGCNTRPRGPLGRRSPCFNPHPTFRPDATGTQSTQDRAILFQPSSDLQAGCNQVAAVEG